MEKIAKSNFAWFRQNAEELIIANKELVFQNEEKEKRATEEYKNIYDNAIEGMFRTSLEGKVMQSNKSLAKMLGYDTANDVVNSVTDSGSQVWANADERLKYAKILEEQEIIQKFECQYKRVDGGIIWVSLNSRLVRDKNGKPLYYEGFVEDITEQKRAEEMLRASKVKYQEIFESTGTATFIGDENGICLMANNECYSITGYTPTEIIGQKWNQYFAPESLPEMLKNHKLRRKNPDLAPKKHDVNLFNKQGEKRDVILNI